MRQTITNEGFLEIFIKNSQGIFSVRETVGRGGKKGRVAKRQQERESAFMQETHQKEPS